MKKTLLSLFLIIAVTGLTFELTSNNVVALSGSEFQAGRIIDDGVFFNSNGMDTNTIQAFLNSKVPTCDTNGNKPRGNMSRAAYGAANGNPAPYTCLKDYVQDTPNKLAEAGLCNAYGAGVKSAANIIYDVSVACNINPKVLLVLLEKEQSLITDDWPWNAQFRSATGFGCPDTAACDAEFYGFFNQVYSAARQYKRYDRDATLFRYRAYRDNYVQFNPDANCLGSTQYIQNQATAGLYNFTPYQPNGPALTNVYGAGDACSAYGNRNFWRLFNDWFGTVYAGNYIARNYTQSTSLLDLELGQEKTVSFKYKNVGQASWKDGQSAGQNNTYPVYLFASNPPGRASGFSSSWPANNRTGNLFTNVYETDGTTLASDQHTVYPGQVVTFEFKLKAYDNVQPGLYTEYFQPILSGSSEWNLGTLSSININLIKPYKALGYRATSDVSTNQNEYADAQLMYKNTGPRPWRDESSVDIGGTPVYLATSYPINRPSVFSASWPANNRPSKTFAHVFESDGQTLAADQHVVYQGQVASYEFRMTAPDNISAGMHSEAFQLIVDGSPYWDVNGSVLTINTNVRLINRSAVYYQQSSYPQLTKGSSALNQIYYRNTGTGTWKDVISASPGVIPIDLATDNPINRASISNYSWPANNRATKVFSRVYESDGTTLTNDQHTVRPNQIAGFEFQLMNYNLETGQLSREWFTPIAEGSMRWRMTDQQVWLDVTGK